jgi:hypothetical protein
MLEGPCPLISAENSGFLEVSLTPLTRTFLNVGILFFEFPLAKSVISTT